MVPLFSVDQNRNADKYAIEQLRIPGVVLMENASRSIIEAVFEKFNDINIFDEIGIVAGRGNNGGDGFSVARQLVNRGFKVNVISIPKKNEIKGDALVNYNVLTRLAKRNKNLKLKHFNSLGDLTILKNCSFIFDAVLGTGTKGKLKEPYTQIIDKLNSFPAYKISIDLPSGLDVHNASGDVVFNADLTVSLGELKTGLFYYKGYIYTGEIVKGSIGIGTEYFDDLSVENYLIEPEDAYMGLPYKAKDLHKYSAGKVLVVAGSGSLPGASFLTTESALKSGAGAVFLVFPKSIKELAQARLKSAITIPYKDDNEYLSMKGLKDIHTKMNWADVVAIGPGLGRELQTVEALLTIFEHHKTTKFVIDADAIFALNGKYKNYNLKNNIITPHHKEFADLLGVELSTLENDLLNFGKRFVKETGSYLVLKGAPTIVFNPQGEVFINSTGNPGMAKFGSGDVLTGIIAGFLAQTHGKNIEKALISAVYLHSLSADLLAEINSELCINSEDILKNLPKAIKFLEDSIVPNT